MSGVVTFFWLDENGAANYVRIPRDEVRVVRLHRDHDVEVCLGGADSYISIALDPLNADLDESLAQKLGNKIIDSIRSLTDENVSWEFDGDRWNSKQSKDSEVWGLSR